MQPNVVADSEGNPATRDAILDAADRLLATVGFRAMTIGDVALEAGVSRRTVYTYFETKAEVGLSSIDRVIGQTHAHLRAIAAGCEAPPERLRRLLIGRVLYRADTVRAYRRGLDELFEALRPSYMRRRRGHFAAEAAIIAPVLRAGRARGEFEFEGARATAMTLVRATNAFLPYALSAEELGRRARLSADVALMVGLLLRGLAAPAAGRGL